ncbi:MAG: hypothetical protein GEU97_05715 [Actinophytocola sp.]|nr:hypothetical protein [Actinophytocola sp.]
MAGEDDNSLGYESPNEKALDTVAGFVPHVRLAQRLYDKLSTPSGAGSGKFEFSVEEMQQLHKEFKAERDAFDRIKERNDQFVQGQLVPMAEDPASKLHYEKAREHYGDVFHSAISEQRDYCDAYCYAIEKAILVKKFGEEEAARRMNAEGSGLT